MRSSRRRRGSSWVGSERLPAELRCGNGAEDCCDRRTLQRAERDGYRVAVDVLRYQCLACGNLTRFDVTTTRTTKAFHHYTLGGDLEIELEEVLSETVDAVACRWCGHGRDVAVVNGGSTSTNPSPAMPATIGDAPPASRTSTSSHG